MTHPWGALPQELNGPGLPNRLYLDTMALHQWFQLDQMADPILSRLVAAGKVVRVETAVEHELSTFFDGAIQQGFLTRVMRHVEVIDFEINDPDAYRNVLVLRRKMEDWERLQGDYPESAKPSRHLGEAATIILILTNDTDAVFVTRDMAAEQFAQGLGVVVVRPLAFVAVEVEFGTSSLDRCRMFYRVFGASSDAEFVRWMTADVQALI